MRFEPVRRLVTVWSIAVVAVVLFGLVATSYLGSLLDGAKKAIMGLRGEGTADGR